MIRLAQLFPGKTAVIEQDMYGKSGAYAYESAKRNLEYLKRIGKIR